jgi:hypothetical protein
MTRRSLMKLTILILPLNFGQVKGSTSYLFWMSRAQFFRYSFELLSASKMQGTPSFSVSLRFPREMLL